MADFSQYTLPGRVSLNTPEISDDEKALLRFCERLMEESDAYREEMKIDQTISHAWQMMEGRHIRARKDKEHRARVNAPLIKTAVTRKAAMLTDALPELNLRSSSGNESTAITLQKGLEGVAAEKDLQDLLLRVIVSAAVSGRAVVGCEWDPFADLGEGDLWLPLYQPDEIRIDPHLRNIARLQDDAEYVIVTQVMPLTKVYEMFPDRAGRIKPDMELSTYQSAKTEIETSRVYHRPSRRQSRVTNSAIPRVRVHTLFLRDRTIHPDNPTDKQGRPNYLFPRKRKIVWAGQVLLADHQSRYWDGLFPVAVMDWGVDPRHQYGDSEIKSLTDYQLSFDLLLSGIVDNARLINDPPWIIEEDAVSPRVLEEIRRYGDRVGWPIVKRPRMEIRRDPPGQQATMVFTTLGVLENLIQTATGIVEVMQGRVPGQIESGRAVANLQSAAQVTIRQQARQVEGFLKSLGRLMISRMIQFYTSDRYFYHTNEWGKTAEFVWRRNEYIKALTEQHKIDLSKKNPNAQADLERALVGAFKDILISVVPMSGLPETVGAKINIAHAFAKEGWMSPEEPLKAARISEPKEVLRKADEYQVSRAMLQAQVAQQLQGMGQVPTPQGNGRVPVPNASQEMTQIEQGSAGASGTPSETGE